MKALKGRRQKAEGRRQKWLRQAARSCISAEPLLPSAFCLLPYFLYVTCTAMSSSVFCERASFWSFSKSYSQIRVLPSLRVALLETTSNGAVIFHATRRFLKASFIIFSVSASIGGPCSLASAFTLSAGFCGFVRMEI